MIARILLCWVLVLPVAAKAVEPAPLVVATFSILGDMTQRIAGPYAQVRVLVGPEIDTHTYHPAPSDAKALKQASLVIANGLGFEPWLDRLEAAAEFKGRRITATDGLTPIMNSAFGRPVPDPHAWQDLTLARSYVHVIAEGLARADPAHAAEYRENAMALNAELADLDKDIRASLQSVAPADRRILTDHDAFAYFGRAYGIEIISLQGVSTDSELSANGLRRIIAQIKASNIRTLFLENLSDPRLSARVAAETGAKLGGTLFSDSLAKPGRPGDTFPDMMRRNATELLTAIKGRAP